METSNIQRRKIPISNLGASARPGQSNGKSVLNAVLVKFTRERWK